VAEGSIFANISDRETYPVGAVIFSAGDPADCMYVVQEGEVEVLVGDRIIDIVGPGGILGELALIDHQPRSATARARSDCELIALDEWRFLYSVQNKPYFALELVRTLAERLRRNAAS
jgi:CRP-like cAMP-binding protein